MDQIEEEGNQNSKKTVPMLYRTEVDKSDKQKRISKDGANSDSDSSDNDSVDESEQLDKVSEAEDMALKENAAKQAGRIINDEQDEIVKVEMQSYAKYFKFAGGWWVIIIFNIIMMFFIACQMAGNYFTQKWAYGSPEDQQDHFEFYAIMIGGANLCSSLLIFVRANFQVHAGLKVGKKLHNILIAYVFRAPINLFFDVTPIGKILNRFSKDLAVIDE